MGHLNSNAKIYWLFDTDDTTHATKKQMQQLSYDGGYPRTQTSLFEIAGSKIFLGMNRLNQLDLQIFIIMAILLGIAGGLNLRGYEQTLSQGPLSFLRYYLH